ncbi:DUF3995 domain-containing protein [Dactylosporangium salmoneum]|uniref:DUF3995 domain-containing protein n=1 Tax=Dactylosporangium salmoneum TaxID=53361 RepID=A0ABN3FGI7_9ACTN
MDSAARTLARASVVVAGWGFCYTLYRAYYAFGGTALLPGRPANPSDFRMINMVATIILLVAAVLPIAMLPLWSRPRVRPVLHAVCWVIAVGCVMHAVIDAAQRVLSLAGLLDIRYPESAWASIDTRTADLQDLFFNEPWFLLEGLGFAALAWIALGPGRPRRAWIGSALAATGALTVVGLLSATGVIGRLIIG